MSKHDDTKANTQSSIQQSKRWTFGELKAAFALAAGYCIANCKCPLGQPMFMAWPSDDPDTAEITLLCAPLAPCQKCRERG